MYAWMPTGMDAGGSRVLNQGLWDDRRLHAFRQTPEPDGLCVCVCATVDAGSGRPAQSCTRIVVHEPCVHACTHWARCACMQAGQQAAKSHEPAGLWCASEHGWQCMRGRRPEYQSCPPSGQAGRRGTRKACRKKHPGMRRTQASDVLHACVHRVSAWMHKCTSERGHSPGKLLVERMRTGCLDESVHACR